MGNSIQDQLLKAGLASKKQAVRARKASNNKKKLKASGIEVVDEVEQLAREEQEKKIARDRELNREKQAVADRKAILAQIKQLIDISQIDKRGDIAFRFTHDSTIRTLMLDTSEHKAVVAGRLAVIYFEDQYFLVPRSVASKIAEREKEVVVVSNPLDGHATEEAETEADEYADYQVPDDLMW